MAVNKRQGPRRRQRQVAVVDQVTQGFAGRENVK